MAVVAPEYLTVTELAERWRVGPRVVYAEIREQRLRSVRVGQQLRVPLDAVHEYENRAPRGSWSREERATAGRRTDPVAPPGPSPRPASGEPS
jgi:excisionase family DNA binding protein